MPSLLRQAQDRLYPLPPGEGTLRSFGWLLGVEAAVYDEFAAGYEG